MRCDAGPELVGVGRCSLLALIVVRRDATFLATLGIQPTKGGSDAELLGRKGSFCDRPKQNAGAAYQL